MDKECGEGKRCLKEINPEKFPGVFRGIPWKYDKDDGCCVDCVVIKERRVIEVCDGTLNDCGHIHHSKCFCNEDQGGGYTFQDEYGDCDFCLCLFKEGTVICADKYNHVRICPDTGREEK